MASVKKKTGETFEGFSREGLSFFRQLSKNNEREWFNSRKGVYEEKCRLPMERLVGEVSERLSRVAVEYVVPEPRKAIYRIYRDTRFAKDKTPYKTHVAAYFQRKGYARHSGPGFYVQVSDKGVGIAGGIYMVGPAEMRAIRDAIVADPKAAEKVLGDKKVTALMGKVQGDALKRAPKEFAEVQGLAGELVRMKQWYYWAELKPEMAMQPGLVKVVSDSLAAMVPMCEWLHGVLAAAAGNEEEHKPKRPEPMF